MDKYKKPPFIITAPKEVISSSYVHVNDYEYKPRIIVDEQGKQIIQKLNPPPEKPNVKAGHTEALIRKVPYQTDPYERQECIERFEALQNQVKVPVPFKCPLRHKVQLKQQTKEAIHSYGKKVVINNLSKLQKSTKSKQQTEKIQVLIQKASTLFTTRKVQQQNAYGFDKKIFQRIDEWKNKLQGITQKQTEELEQSKVSFHKHRLVTKNQQLKNKKEELLKKQSKSLEKDLSMQTENTNRPKTAQLYKPAIPSYFNKNTPTPIQIKPDDISIIKSEIEKKPRIQTPKSIQSKNINQSPKHQQLVKQQSSQSIKQIKDNLSKEKSFSNKDSNHRKRQITEEERKTNNYTEERKSQGRDGRSNRSEERKSDQNEQEKQKHQAKFIRPRINRMQSAKNNQGNYQKDPQQKKGRPSSAGGNTTSQKPINIKDLKVMSQQRTQVVKGKKENDSQHLIQEKKESSKPLEIIESTVTVVEPKKSRFRQGSKKESSNEQQVPPPQKEQPLVQQEPERSESQVNMGLVNVNAPQEQSLATIQFQQIQTQDLTEKEKQLRVSQMASTHSLVYKQDLNSLKDSLISESLLVSQFKESSMKDNQFASQFKESQLIQSQLNDQESITLSESQVTVQPVVKKRRFVSRQE